MLDPKLSRTRQKRLLDQMQRERLDAAVVAQPHHVYYFSAFLTDWLHQSAFVLFSDGRSWLATANAAAKHVAADDVAAFEAQWMATLRQEQPAVVAELVIEQLKERGSKRVGIDGSPVTTHVALGFEGDASAIDSTLWQLRRIKDADELALMRTA